MFASEANGDWHLRAVTTGETLETLKARDLLREISEATWLLRDPGMQYDTTINRWHTCPNSRADQRVEPVLGVHAHRRLGLQPRVAEPHEVRR